MTNSSSIKHPELSGIISAEMHKDKRLDDFCIQHIPGYNPDRMEAIAVRLYAGKENYITVFALDKNVQENSAVVADQLPVLKFRINQVSPEMLFAFFAEYNFTLSTGNYDLEDMVVIATGNDPHIL